MLQITYSVIRSYALLADAPGILIDDISSLGICVRFDSWLCKLR
jgi:hypothetical protein